MINLSEYAKYDGLGLADLVRRGEVTPEELKTTAIEGIEKINPKLNAVVSVLSIQAKKEIASGLHEGPFKGVPFLIKELVLHADGVPMSMGSHLMKNTTFSWDTELMARFRKAGLVTVGTTTTPEFGNNATTEAVIYGPTRNPWSPDRSAGGSSGGSAAMVAARVVPMAHANDAGGSIRIPSSCCGVFGLKPTRGRVPLGPDYGDIMHGMPAELAVTRSVRDMAALLDAVSGPDVGAPFWAERPTRLFIDEVSANPGRLRIAWMKKPLNGAPVDQECVKALKDTVKLCEELGHELVEAAPEIEVNTFFEFALPTIWIANIANMIEGGARALGRTPTEENLEATTWAYYQRGKKIMATDLLAALDVFAGIQRAVGKFFVNHDILLTPTVAKPPLPLGELNANAPGVDAIEWTNQIFSYAPYTVLFNVTGQPAMSVPLAWSSDNLPIGMQFVGRYADEATLFRLGSQLEQVRPWKDKRPSVHIES